MDFTLTQEQQQIQKMVRDFAENELRPTVIERDEKGEFPMELFKKLNQEKGMTILQVTHSEKCASYGTRVITLDNGKTVG